MLILRHSLRGITVFVGAISSPREGQAKGDLQISGDTGTASGGPCREMGAEGEMGAEAEATHGTWLQALPQVRPVFTNISVGKNGRRWNLINGNINQRDAHIYFKDKGKLIGGGERSVKWEKF